MNTEVRALTIRHLEDMGQHDRLLNRRRMSGPGYTFFLDNRPIAAAGLGRVQGREYFAWVIMLPEVRASKLLMRKLTREVKRFYPITRDLVQAEAVQTETLDSPKYCKWLEQFGFKRLAIVRHGWTREGCGG